MRGAAQYMSEVTVRRRRRRAFVLLLVGGGVVVSILALGNWFFISSPLFHIQKIDITGTALIPREDVSDVLQAEMFGGSWWRSILGGENILVWPHSVRPARLATLIPAIEKIEISKNYITRTVAVTVEERAPIGIWCFRSQGCWWFDGKGIMFRRSPSTEGGSITTIEDYSQNKGGSGMKILPDRFIENFLSIITEAGASPVGLKKIVIKDLSREEVEVTTQALVGPKLYFSLRFPADGARAALEHLYAKTGFKNLEYVDFRVEDKVYYR